ncbi:MAG: glycoside hydrolase family 5 protein [Phycisphaeraceae bacterium JB051]
MTDNEKQLKLSLCEKSGVYPNEQTLHGVNLGNWLVLEKWMSPGLYSSPDQRDEYTLCEALGDKAEGIMRAHRESWITEEDFKWLANWGINAIRLPFGYWILDADGPYVDSIDIMDQAVDWCEQYGMKLLLDLHGLPGCQGPEHHTGRCGHFQWPKDPSCYAKSLDLIEQFAQRYKDKSCINGFSVVNEPHESIDSKVLIKFYEESIERVRKHMPADQVAAVIAAYPENLMPTYHGCVPQIENVMTDVHLYQSFIGWENRDPFTYIYAASRRGEQLGKWAKQGPFVVGEWSLSWPQELHDVLNTWPTSMYDQLMRAYASTQLAAFEQSNGWYFWSYKVIDRPHWSFRDAVERGWFPSKIDG